MLRPPPVPILPVVAAELADAAPVMVWGVEPSSPMGKEVTQLTLSDCDYSFH